MLYVSLGDGIYRGEVFRLEAVFETRYEACTCVGGEDVQLGYKITSFWLSTPQDGVYREIILRAYDYSVL